MSSLFSGSLRIPAALLRDHIRALVDAKCRDNPRLRSLIAGARFSQPFRDNSEFWQFGERLPSAWTDRDTAYAPLEEACRRVARDFVADFARLVEKRQPERVDFMTRSVVDVSMDTDAATGDIILAVCVCFAFDPDRS